MSLLLSSMQPHARCGCSSCAVHNKSGALTLSLQWSCNLMYRYQSRAYTATCSLHQSGLSTASGRTLNRNRKLKTSKALLESRTQGATLFTSAASSQRSWLKCSCKEVRVKSPEGQKEQNSCWVGVI